MAKGLEKALQEFVEQVDDLATLEVITLSGEVMSVIKEGGKALDWDKLLEKAFDANVKINLVAATKVSPDYDVLNFRAETASEPLLQLHSETLKASREGREAIVKLFIDTATSFIKPTG